MTLTKDQIEEAALHLTPSDRMNLAEALLLSVTTDDREKIDAAWLTEVKRRDLSSVVVGTNAKTVQQVLSSLDRRLGA